MGLGFLRMIIKLDQKIDIKKLKDYLEFVKKTYPPHLKQNGVWGGWSITSSDGSIHDGWQAGEKVNDPEATAQTKNDLLELFTKNSFTTPTPLFKDYILEVVQRIKEIDPKIQLSRIRIAVLAPHDETEAYWHIDGDLRDNEKKFRLHIPIITNEKCFFDYENERHHLDADGSIYIIDVSKKHRAVNLSNESRYHLIMNIHYSR